MKKDSNYGSCKTVNAKKQLARYIGGRLKAQPELILTKPSITLIKGSDFSYQDSVDGYNYSVSYWSEGSGILRYSYTRTKTELRKLAENVANVVKSIAGAVLTGLMGGTSTFPGLVY